MCMCAVLSGSGIYGRRGESFVSSDKSAVDLIRCGGERLDRDFNYSDRLGGLWLQLCGYRGSSLLRERKGNRSFLNSGHRISFLPQRESTRIFGDE